MFLSIVKELLISPEYRFRAYTKLGLTFKMSDEQYLKKKFKLTLGYDLNLNNPQTFNEKLQWLKIHDRKPEYTIMVDKYRVREYIAKKIGEEYLIPLLGVWDSPDEIDFDKLPDQFVLKCNHCSGGNSICRNKSHYDIKRVKRMLKNWLKRQYYYYSREWPYKDVPRKIICEKFMAEKISGGITDYKFYCFNGIPKFLYVSKGLENHKTAKISFLKLDWTFADFHRTDYEPFDVLPPKPQRYDEMLRIAHILSDGNPFLRVDLYEIEGKIYFGELTFSPCGGFMKFEPHDWDKKLGEMIDINLK